MFDSIHQTSKRWLWYVIGGIVILSFVWFFMPDRYGHGGGGRWPGNRG